MSQLYLIRHGQAGPRHAYDTLSELGERQARMLGEHLAAAGVRFDRAVAGRLVRQQRTAQAVRQVYLDAGLPFPEVETSPLWDEFDLGEVYRQLAEPLSHDDAEFARLYTEMVEQMSDEHAAVHRVHNYCDIAMVRAWVEAAYAYSGESWIEFRARIHDAVESMNGGGTGERAAVFTSATPVGISVGRALGLGDEQVWRLAGATYNSGVTTLRIAPEELRLFTFNAVGHLPDSGMWSSR